MIKRFPKMAHKQILSRNEKRPPRSSLKVFCLVVLLATISFQYASRTSILTKNLVEHRSALQFGSTSLSETVSKKRLIASPSELPLAFEVNEGQTDRDVKFLSRGEGYTLYLGRNKAVISLRKPEQNVARAMSTRKRNRAPSVPESPGLRRDEQGFGKHVVQLEMLRGNSCVQTIGEEPLAGKSNYFIGNDPKKWHTNVANYARVRYREVYPGVDLVYYGNQGQLEYDFVVSPGADPHTIELRIAAQHEPLSPNIERNGDLSIAIEGAKLRFHRPLAYQTDDGGEKRYVQTDYVVSQQGRKRGWLIHLRLAEYDHTKPLVIDPTLSYSTFLGGTRQDFANAIAVDNAGNAYVTGQTLSIDFPLKNAYQGKCENCNLTKPGVFVSKLSADGRALVYSTYLGGTNSSTQTGSSIAVDASGSAYITGATQATDFPTTAGTYRTCLACPITQNAPFGNTDGFVTKLDPTGSQLVYSTYLGGSGGFSGDAGNGIVVDALGSAFVAGSTNSLDFPTTANAFQSKCTGCNTNGGVGFVTKLNPNGQIPLAYSTYLGGGDGSFTTGDSANGIAIDSTGNSYVAGTATSPDFPTTTGAFQQHFHVNEGPAVFVTKLKSDGSGPLIYSTLIGGTASDDGLAIAIDPQGNSYITGRADSTDFPTTKGAFQTTHPNPGSDSPFVTKLNQTGSALAYSTFLDGTSPSTIELGNSIAIDAAGNAYLTGRTGAPNFPTTPDALRTTCSGCADKVFVSVLNPAGQALLYSTYLGGSGIDLGNGIALDRFGNLYVTGSTFSSNFPVTPGAFQTTCSGGCVLNDLDHPETDAFVAKFSPSSAATKKRRAQLTSQ